MRAPIVTQTHHTHTQVRVYAAFENHREHNEFADVTLAWEDGQHIEARKVILAVSSDLHGRNQIWTMCEVQQFIQSSWCSEWSHYNAYWGESICREKFQWDAWHIELPSNVKIKDFLWIKSPVTLRPSPPHQEGTRSLPVGGFVSQGFRCSPPHQEHSRKKAGS